MIKTGQNTTNEIWRYDSWFDFVDHSQNRKLSTDVNCSRNSLMGDEWTGTRSFGEAVRLAKEGWPVGAEKVGRLSAKLYDKITSRIERPQVVYDVTGNDFDVAMVNEGVPESWYHFDTSEVQNGKGTKVLKLVFNCSVSGGISTDVMIAKGAVVCALVESLEYAGCRVEIDVVEATTYYDQGLSKFSLIIPTKEANQHMDRDKLAFALAHPSVLRRLVFGVEEENGRFMKIAGTGYGMPADPDVSEHGDIFIGHSMLGEPQWTNEVSSVDWVIKQLKEQNVTIDDD
jgi:hypothetical protein